jgi:hypothetical protein
MSITAEHKSAANEQKSATNEQKSTSWQKGAKNEQKNAAKVQKSATPPIAKLLHNVVIILNKNGYAEREREMPELHYGELVRYITTEPGAKASMAFPDLSPYRTDDQKDTEIPDSQIMELVRPLRNGQASFLGRCYLTLADGKKVGWDPANYELGGGDHRVQKP